MPAYYAARSVFSRLFMNQAVKRTHMRNAMEPEAYRK